MSISVEQLSTQLGLKCFGNTSMDIESVANVTRAGHGQLTFLVSDKKLDELDESLECAVITNAELAAKINAAATIISDNPQLTFARATPLVLSKTSKLAQVHPQAIVSNSAVLDADVTIGAGAVIDDNVRIERGVQIGSGVSIGKDSHIGADTVIDANVTVYANSQVGERCQISSGTVIGSPGFGIVPDGEKWLRFPQLGRVLIGDDVDVGANCCIDRGALDDTIIDSGVKLDNLIQVAHNVCIGENTVIAACTGIAGSAKIGKNCRIGGRASIQGHITIADNVVITTCTFVNKSIFKPGAYSSSLSAQENSTWLKNHARLHRLDKLSRQFNTMEKQFKQFTGRGDGSDK